jgi:ribokinase
VPEEPGAVVVVGSINQDYVFTVDRRPEPGETVLSRDVAISAGGKGANQAVAAARMGATTLLVGSVGDDSDGHRLMHALDQANVRTSYVAVNANLATGRAFVTVTPDGENAIVVAAGANMRIFPSQIRAALKESSQATTLAVISTELDVRTILEAVRTANEVGARCVLNLAPFTPLPDETLAACDPLIVNESEASALSGHRIADVTSAQKAMPDLLRRVRSLVVTLGARGALVAVPESVRHVPAPQVSVVDTTGAGDAFVGALAARLAAGDDLYAAVETGVAAGSFAVTGLGAQSSYPTPEALRSNPHPLP